MSKLLQLTCLTLFSLLSSSVDARQSFRVKENLIKDGLSVNSPRVQASDCKWCFMNDGNNEFCVETDIDWKLE